MPISENLKVWKVVYLRDGTQYLGSRFVDEWDEHENEVKGSATRWL